MTWAILLLAIALEVAGTTALKLSEQFTRLPWALATAVCYGFSFWLLSMVLRTMPVGIAYAVWSGFGMVLVTLIGRVGFGQRLDAAAWAGIGLIIAGVLVLNLVSRAGAH